MKKKQMFNKYYYKAALSAMIKSAFYSAVAGFVLSIIVAFIAITCNNFNAGDAIGFYLSLGIGAISMIIALPLFYFLFFKPKTKDMLQHIDRLQADERLGVMLEIQWDESFLAMLRREEAKAKFRARKNTRFSISALSVAVIIMVSFFSMTMATLTITEFEHKIPWNTIGVREVFEAEIPDEIIPVPEPMPNAEVTFFKVIFAVYLGAGYIEGDTFQVVLKGDDTTKIVATPMPGWKFACWDFEEFDEDYPQRTDPERIIRNVDKDYLLWARFHPAGETNAGTHCSEPPDSVFRTIRIFSDPNLILNNDKRYDSDKYWIKYYEDAMHRLDNDEIPQDLQIMLKEYWKNLTYP